jgi:hypothetical protein
MPNRAIEFHDSTLLSVTVEGADIRVALCAYVHESEGEPGVHAGTGWVQELEFLLASAVAEAMPPQEPLKLADGRVVADDRVFDGELPLPFAHSGSVRLELEAVGGDLRVVARGFRIIERGERRFVEDVPPLG